MNDLCVDIGWKSINHEGEQLCGDHVDIVEQDENSIVVVLADGMGSGVKASILSTLTSKIISTMMAEGLKIEDCVSAIAAALPICQVRKVAYSTFTILHIIENERVELIQYDNPAVIFIRDDEIWDYPKQELYIEGKKIYKSEIRLQENDIMVAMSDGCPHAGSGLEYNTEWEWEDIANYVRNISAAGYSAKNLATMLVDECNREYAYKPTDDATACILKVRKREPVNILFGPPRNRDDSNRMMTLYFSKAGKHIICGGTTASIAAKYLRKEVRVNMALDEESDVPPISEIDGVDLVTEGVITMSRVVEYAKDSLEENELYEKWGFGHDGASLICRMLFEEATDVNFYVGRAVNPAHQNPDLPISFNIKMQLVKELTEYLGKMGKRVKVSYF
ncbi:MAG: SpoIIE family protein phosphatase [Lachnospiraceae bacterium]|nr:SpoIIE family protein phosphatase [Lachnospiraceae bacterium]